MRSEGRVVLIYSLLVLFAYIAMAENSLSFEELKLQQLDIQQQFKSYPVRFTLIFSGLFISMAGLGIPGSMILTIGSGSVFGFLPGLLLSNLASTLGATLCFLAVKLQLGRWFGSKFPSFCSKIQEGYGRQGKVYLFILRVMPAVPYALVNVAMGVTRIPTWEYIWVSFLGLLPGSILLVNAGTQIGGINHPREIYSLDVVLSFLLLAVFPLFIHRLLGVLRRRGLIRSSGFGATASGYLASSDKAREKNSLGSPWRGGADSRPHENR